MNRFTIGIIRERKSPPDERVPLTPEQCRQIKVAHPQIHIVVEPSPIRCFSDDAYRAQGLDVRDDLSDCDVLIGVKEVPKEHLLPGKKYMFFSHTYKKQPYNRDLLAEILRKNITLYDYELITNSEGRRLIGFGRYAGVVGAYNALRGYGLRSRRYELKPAHECENRAEVDAELSKVSLPKGFRMVVTGGGRVAGGALEILRDAGILAMQPSAFLEQRTDEPVYTQLSLSDYFVPASGGLFDRANFEAHPEQFRSNFMKFAQGSDLYIACHYWSEGSPFIFSRADARDPRFDIQFVADISCDIDGPVASTLRPSTIADPFYGYDPYTESEVDWNHSNAIGVMAVDNLPCELPADASADFGSEFIQYVLPAFLNNDADGVLHRAQQTNESGALTESFIYLRDWVEGRE